MERDVLKKKLEEWENKVLNSYGQKGGVNTYQMIVDVDKIIAEAFNHTPVLVETD